MINSGVSPPRPAAAILVTIPPFFSLWLIISNSRVFSWIVCFKSLTCAEIGWLLGVFSLFNSNLQFVSFHFGVVGMLFPMIG